MKYCPDCGTKLEDNMRFCINCGAAQPKMEDKTAVVSENVKVEEPVAEEKVEVVEAPVKNEETVETTPAMPAEVNVQITETEQQTSVADTEAAGKLATGSLVKGIIALAFCESIPLLSIILGAIGKKEAKEYLAMCGVLSGKAKAGKILSSLGLAFGIVCLVAYTLLIVVVICSVLSGSAGAIAGTTGSVEDLIESLIGSIQNSIT